MELERLEAECKLDIIYVAQPTENTPVGRMMRRTLANMASFYTEQQSVDVRDGLQRRVEAGLGAHTYKAHELVYGSELVRWGECGHPITGERKTKQSRSAAMLFATGD